MRSVFSPPWAVAVESHSHWHAGFNGFLAALAFVTFACASPPPKAFAEPPETPPSAPGIRSLFSLSTGDIGVAFRGSNLTVHTKFSDLVLVEMSTGFSPTLTLNLQSPARYFGKTAFGYALRYGLDLFSMDTQAPDPGSNQEDLGTGADGSYVYVMPMLVVDLMGGEGGLDLEMEKVLRRFSRVPEGSGETPSVRLRRRGILLRIGLGYAVGYLRTEGDFIPYDDLGSPLPSERRRIDISGLTWGPSGFLELNLAHLVFALHMKSFHADSGHYDYQVEELAFNVGYRSRL